MWTQVAANPSPAPRDSAVMATLDGELVLFGGQNLDARPPLPIETWTFDVGGFASGWTKVTTTQWPVTPVLASMAPLNGALVLFGGETNGLTGDTWSFDGKDWTNLQIAGPSPRFSAAMAPIGGKLVLFGGFDQLAPKNLGETWIFDGATWQELQVSGPSARSSPSMARLGDKLVLFGGYDGKDEDDTWTFDGATWTRVDVPGPPGRWLAAMTSM
jgi:N-acetylneuraminic acid mutarotase